MNKDELKNALDRLFAYDSGSTGSGIHDEQLRSQVMDELDDMDYKDVTVLFREMWWSEQSLKQGYTVEDFMGFMRWLGDYMQYSII